MLTVEEMKQRKAELGYSNRRLAEESGVPLGTVNKIFAGTTATPRFETLQALDRILRKNGDKRSYLDSMLDYMEQMSPLIVQETAAHFGKRQGEFTIEDFFNLPPDSPRMELIDGAFFPLGEPSPAHQIVVGSLYHAFFDHISRHNGTCIPLVSPIAVQLSENEQTIVEPDVTIVCDRSKFRRNRVLGAPDLVVEVLSPSTRSRDLTQKLAKYQQHGVHEYWLVDLKRERVLVYPFEEEIWPEIYTFNDTIPVHIWNGECQINMTTIKDGISFLPDVE